MKAERTRDVIDTFRMVAKLKKLYPPEAIRLYVISGTESANDLFDWLKLAKLCGLLLAASARRSRPDAGPAIRIDRFAARRRKNHARGVDVRRNISRCSIPGTASRK